MLGCGRELDGDDLGRDPLAVREATVESPLSGAAPGFNHAWYVWDWLHDGPPLLAYAP
jgi:hypothetical protein